MTDIFPVQMFTLQNAISQIESNQYQAGVYFSFNAFIREGLLNPELSLDQRSLLFEICMIFSLLFYQYLEDSHIKGFTYHEKNMEM